MKLISIILLAAVASSCLAEVVSYNWDITWINAAPDGTNRPVIGVNGQWPPPPIEATVGDRVVVNVKNKLENETTSLHFHGIHQRGTNEMDGSSRATQCPIPPGHNFTYNFIVDKPGTYWYHSHTGGQYPDGLRGPLIVHDPKDPYAGEYDEEYVLTVSDWYHAQVPELLHQLLSPENRGFRPPIPNSGLLNDGLSATLKFVPHRRYKIRVINMGALASTMLEFDSHIMTITEIDGVYVHKHRAKQIRITPGQRYAFILKAKPTAEKNYAFLAALDLNPDYTQPGAIWPINVTGEMVYNSEPAVPTLLVKHWDPVDDLKLKPYDNEQLLESEDNKIILNFRFGFDSFGIPRAYMNNITYVGQNVPTLYSVLTVGEDAENPEVYGQVNPFVVEYGRTVELVLNNLDDGIHPFHLHGHQFQVCDRPARGAGSFRGGHARFPSIPMRRDTVHVNGLSYVVLRFKADNPGVWLFHCHIEWHVEMGLVATIVEAPEELQRSIVIPEQHLEVCKAQCMSTAGNAAGNTINHLDLTGANTAPPNPDNGALYTKSGCPTPTGPTTASTYPRPTPSQNHKTIGTSISSENIHCSSAVPVVPSGKCPESTVRPTYTSTGSSPEGTRYSSSSYSVSRPSKARNTGKDD